MIPKRHGYLTNITSFKPTEWLTSLTAGRRWINSRYIINCSDCFPELFVRVACYMTSPHQSIDASWELNWTCTSNTHIVLTDSMTNNTFQRKYNKPSSNSFHPRPSLRARASSFKLTPHAPLLKKAPTGPLVSQSGMLARWQAWMHSTRVVGLVIHNWTI